MQVTGWYNSRQKPRRPGLYQTTCDGIGHLFGLSYSLWDGQQWLPVRGWTVYHLSPGFHWQGQLSPLKAE